MEYLPKLEMENNLNEFKEILEPSKWHLPFETKKEENQTEEIPTIPIKTAYDYK
jgi:hypothetical protein